ncbi:endonuclease domain-containing protein [Sphingomonas sp. MMS24-J13]|uniref:endonuclease domain-containing protein n=1 Tax=Sphingomonas sp. MMS24-J13 TaxID=3238686 RepID=UPI00384ABF77
MIAEIDGSQHSEAVDYDAHRDAALMQLGYRTLLFWNNDVSGNLDAVYETIRLACFERLPSPSPRYDGPISLASGEPR